VTREELRRVALFAAVQTALVAAIWLFAIVVYALAVEGEAQPLWTVIDVALIAGAVAFMHRRRDLLGFGSLGSHKAIKLVAIALGSTALVLAWHLVVRDWDMISLDETHYLRTVRAGKILCDGRIPYNMRWFVPFFAGKWNFIPVDDIAAVKAAMGMILCCLALSA